MLVGKTLRNRYKIIKQLGGGGFGDTYLAEDTDLPGNPQCVVTIQLPKENSDFVLLWQWTLTDLRSPSVF